MLTNRLLILTVKVTDQEATNYTGIVSHRACRSIESFKMTFSTISALSAALGFVITPATPVQQVLEAAAARGLMLKSVRGA